MQELKTQQKLKDDGRVAGVVFLPRLTAHLAKHQTFLREATCHNFNEVEVVVEELQRRASLRQYGNRSSRRSGLGLSRSSFHRIAKLDIRFHPCIRYDYATGAKRG